MCASGLCINGTCTNEVLDANEQCNQDADCKSNACALGVANTATSPICCESGETTDGYALNGYASVCTQMELGAYCHEIDSMCASGLCILGTCADHLLVDHAHCDNSAQCESYACGRAAADSSAPFICCESGETTTGGIRSDDSMPASSPVCTNMAIGTYCEYNDLMCASGLCINGVCANEELDDKQYCRLPSDCKSDACALSFADAEAPLICCTGWAYQTWSKVLNSDDSHYVCTNAISGVYCHENDDVCASKICINSHCVEERLEAFENCTKATDCKSNACGLASANSEGPQVCCDGDAIEITGNDNVFSATTSTAMLCGNAAVGTYCHTINEICASGLCFNETCTGMP